jgi:hypothetical protein
MPEVTTGKKHSGRPIATALLPKTAAVGPVFCSDTGEENDKVNQLLDLGWSKQPAAQAAR